MQRPLQMQMPAHVLRLGIWRPQQEHLLVQMLVEAEGLAMQGSAGAEAGAAVQYLGQQQQQQQQQSPSERLVVQKGIQQ